MSTNRNPQPPWPLWMKAAFVAGLVWAHVAQRVRDLVWIVRRGAR